MKRILFVEDDVLIARVYTQKISESGFEVSWAEDGLVAMKRLMEVIPDLVVLDLMMPRFSGVDVLKFMRRTPELKATRVIIFSNSFLGGLIDQVGTTGVEKVLIKSSSTPAELVRAINQVFEEPIHPFRDPPTVPQEPARPRAPVRTAPAALGRNSPGTFLIPGAIPDKSDVSRDRSAITEVGRPVTAATEESQPDPGTRARREFHKHGSASIAGVCTLCREFVETSEPAEQVARLVDLHRKVRFLTQMALNGDCPQFTRLASALEALVFELQEKTEFINDSTRHTIAATVRLLAERFQHLDEPEDATPASLPVVLVVDDDAVSNRALVFALSRLQLNAVSMTDPLVALKALQEQAFDLILLDISMAGMDGLTLCERLRELPHHHQTPVVFVTSYDDMKTRTLSLLSGGNDFIIKPVLPVELCVKAITHLLARPASQFPSTAALVPGSGGA